MSKNPNCTITLLHINIEVGHLYRWQRDEDKAWVSPPFNTMEAALYMAGKMPFLTDDDWKKLHPVPDHLKPKVPTC